MTAAVIGSVARHTGIYIVRKYDRDLLEYIDAFGQVEGMVRFYTENQPYETIRSGPNKMISSGQANGVASLYFRTMASTGFMGGVAHDVARNTASGVVRHWDNPLNNSCAAIGVGDQTTAEGGASLDLNPAAINNNNVAYIGTNGTDPSFTANVLSVTCAFTGGIGNFAWQELICGNFSTGTGFSLAATGSGAPAAGLPTGTETNNSVTTRTYALLSRVVTPLGTKASGTTWTVTYQLTIS